jgi:hypothetical protein
VYVTKSVSFSIKESASLELLFDVCAGTVDCIEMERQSGRYGSLCNPAIAKVVNMYGRRFRKKLVD